MNDVPRPLLTRGGLSRESIAAEALKLIDTLGLEDLSMRRLGKALGVEAMALYHHYRNKGEILDAVMEQLLAEAVLPPRGEMSALDRLEAFSRSYRAIAVRHPHAFVLLTNRRYNTPAAFALYERVLEAFADLGLDPRLQAYAFRMLGYFISGAGLAEIASRAEAPDATPVQLEAFSDRGFPHIAAVAPYLRLAELDNVFEFGLRALFDHIAHLADSA